MGGLLVLGHQLGADRVHEDVISGSEATQLGGPAIVGFVITIGTVIRVRMSSDHIPEPAVVVVTATEDVMTPGARRFEGLRLARRQLEALRHVLEPAET